MSRGPCNEHLGEGDWELFLFTPWMEEELKKEEKGKGSAKKARRSKGGRKP